MTSLFDIADSLSKLYYEKTAGQVRTWQMEQDAEALKLEITPAEGWPGKNEAERSIARDKAWAANENLQNLVDDLLQLKSELALIQTDIEAQEAQRRALEWNIRERLADALSGRRNGHGPVEEQAFDDGTLAEMEERLAVEAQAGLNINEAMEDVPF
jgi:hypothetical protein